mgnify:CR=1 FL=1
MLTAIGAAALAAALFFFFARRFFPRRRWLRFLGLTLAAVGTFFLCQPEPPSRPTSISPEERALITAQQQAVAAWYADYQRLIGRLDHNWQQYHRILSDFNGDLIDLETAHDRLVAVEAATAEEEAQVKQMVPPDALSETNHGLVTAILKKTQNYAAAQHQAVRLTALAADPQRQTSPVQEEQSRHLREVMITESPAGLFTANELTALRDNLRLPE